MSSCRRRMDRGIRNTVLWSLVVQCECSTFAEQQACSESSKSCHRKQIARLKLLSQTEAKTERHGMWKNEREGGREGARKESREGKKDRRAARETAKRWMKQGTNNGAEVTTDGKKRKPGMEWAGKKRERRRREGVRCVLSQTRGGVWQKPRLIHNDCQAERMLNPQSERERERGKENR